eukprot:CAMPEP_0113935796 /NCGR_PEP_ID=MMETSP1339-20121228/2868_1 /TAXON_ID=94617 /ORGANISM="Fibrocapsa japonica" /LENGTH=257 /DNA_ID=CAMNT_0000938063 /DNA_START=135 /DNA_END=908 /DNA_ORIENTATION=+ /assembly_acc=CAM_ASM_000762
MKMNSLVLYMFALLPIVVCGPAPLLSSVAVHQHPAPHDNLVTASIGESIDMEPEAMDITVRIAPRPGKITIARKFWNWYNSRLDQYPLITKMCTGTVCGFLGDLAYQFYRDYKYDIPMNMYRMVMFTVVTCFYHAPFIHWWFEFSANKSDHISNKAVRVSSLILADNFLFCPVINPIFVFLAAFLCTPNIFGTPLGETWSGAIDQMNREAWPVLRKCWSMWPFVHFYNYTYVEPKHRVLVTYLASIVWKFLLSSCIR